MALQLPVIFPSLAYAITFSYTNVLLTVEIPSLLGLKYGLNEQQVGLQFVGAVIGLVLGEIVGGKGSDLYVAWRTRRAHGERLPEMRLPVAIPGIILAVRLMHHAPCAPCRRAQHTTAVCGHHRFRRTASEHLGGPLGERLPRNIVDSTKRTLYRASLLLSASPSRSQDNN